MEYRQIRPEDAREYVEMMRSLDLETDMMMLEPGERKMTRRPPPNPPCGICGSRNPGRIPRPGHRHRDVQTPGCMGRISGNYPPGADREKGQ